MATDNSARLTEPGNPLPVALMSSNRPDRAACRGRSRTGLIDLELAAWSNAPACRWRPRSRSTCRCTSLAASTISGMLASAP